MNGKKGSRMALATLLAVVLALMLQVTALAGNGTVCWRGVQNYNGRFRTVTMCTQMRVSDCRAAGGCWKAPAGTPTR